MNARAKSPHRCYDFGGCPVKPLRPAATDAGREGWGGEAGGARRPFFPRSWRGRPGRPRGGGYLRPYGRIVMLRDRHRFRRLAWGALAYTLLVILWGGYVRASGSGAGCGAHWPLCNGEVVPRSATAETLIELTHRVTSGLALPLVLVLLAWAFRAFPKGSPVRKGAAFVVAFMVLEAAVGAGLVLFEQVAYNASIGRAYWMASHLVNTFLLLGALTLTAHAARGGAMPRLRGSGRRGPLVGGALLGLLVLGASGAVTALGD